MDTYLVAYDICYPKCGELVTSARRSDMFMSATNQESARHSAIVHMQLYVNGCVMPIAQLGPNFLVLRNPIDHPPVDADIAMSIDGREDRWRVRLPEGMKSEQRKTAISKVSGFNGPAVK